MNRSTDNLSGTTDALALQLCSTCVGCAAHDPVSGRDYLIGSHGIEGCSAHERQPQPPIGEGLVGWYPTAGYLNAAEVAALGSFRLPFEVCPICRKRVPTDGAHAVRKKSGGRQAGRDGFRVELCRPCHNRLDSIGDQSLAVCVPSYDDRDGFVVVVLDHWNGTVTSREITRIRGTVGIQSGRWKGRA